MTTPFTEPNQLAGEPAPTEVAARLVDELDVPGLRNTLEELADFAENTGRLSEDEGRRVGYITCATEFGPISLKTNRPSDGIPNTAGEATAIISWQSQKAPDATFDLTITAGHLNRQIDLVAYDELGGSEDTQLLGIQSIQGETSSFSHTSNEVHVPTNRQWLRSDATLAAVPEVLQVLQTFENAGVAIPALQEYNGVAAQHLIMDFIEKAKADSGGPVGVLTIPEDYFVTDMIYLPPELHPQQPDMIVSLACESAKDIKGNPAEDPMYQRFILTTYDPSTGEHVDFSVGPAGDRYIAYNTTAQMYKSPYAGPALTVTTRGTFDAGIAAKEGGNANLESNTRTFIQHTRLAVDIVNALGDPKYTTPQTQ